MSVSDLIRRRLVRVGSSKRRRGDSAPGKAVSPTSQATIQRALTSPRSLQAAEMLYLQRTIGNRSVLQMLHNSGKESPARSSGLTVGPSNDRFEQEADAIAATVTSSEQAGVQRASSTPPVGAEGGEVSSDLAQRIEQAKGGGRPVPENVQRVMAQKTGADFSNVRVHHDSESDAISSQLGAKAATHGKDIFLARNQSPNDMRLMAHELTHTIHQGAVKVGGESKNVKNTVSRAPAIQRDDDEDELKKLKWKRRGAKAAFGALKALDWITTAPLHLIDELSVADLHAKDFVNYARTGKRRKQRGADGDWSKFAKGSAKRALGRTGLRGYLSGMKSHKYTFGQGIPNAGVHLPWFGKANPFTSMQLGAGYFKQKAKQYTSDISGIRNRQNAPTSPDGSILKFKKQPPQDDIDPPSTPSNEESGTLDSESSEYSSTQEEQDTHELPELPSEEEEEIIEAIKEMKEEEESEEV